MIDALDSLRNCEAVRMAGGLDGFVREVLAEAKTTAIARARAERLDDPDAIADMAKATVATVIERRLAGLFHDEIRAALDYAFDLSAGGVLPGVAAALARDRLHSRRDEICAAVANAIG